MFEGFRERRIATGGAEIHAVVGGDGPPLALLHGYPQTHVMWHRVAPRLAEAFTVVAPDLRGYGRSSKPPGGEGSVNYAKRAMARDVVEVMAALGHDRFLLAGHDRGGRVAYRLALDHPDRVRRLATLDIMPTLEQFERMDRRGAVGSFHWFLLAQPSPLPERLIGGDPVSFLHDLLSRWSGAESPFAPEAMADYERSFRDPETVRATCDDYRAGATIDCDLDAADRDAGRRISCPMLALWGDRGGDRRAVMMEVWERWATDLRGAAIPCGHFLPEEAPDETAAALLDFFRAG